MKEEGVKAEKERELHGEWNSFRKDTGGLIEKGDLKGLLEKSDEFHGHICPYSAYGVKAGYIAACELGIRNTGMEEVVAIVETNNCFSDGIQLVTGCTFGNNGLIFRDYGKTAVTVARRDGTAIRIALNPDFEESIVKKYPEANALFEKIVVRREEATEEERKRMMQLFTGMSFELLDVPGDEMFIIEHKTINLPAYAPIFSSVRCAICGELIMETRARVKGGKFACIECAGDEYYLLTGAGISIAKSDEV